MSCTVHAKFYLPIHAGDFGIWIRQTCSHYVLVHPLKIRFWACSHTSKPDFTKEHQWCLGRSYLMFFSLLTPLPLSGIEMLCMWAQQGDLKKCFNFSNKVSSAAGNTLQISWFLNPTVSSDWKEHWHIFTAHKEQDLLVPSSSILASAAFWNKGIKAALLK